MKILALSLIAAFAFGLDPASLVKIQKPKVKKDKDKFTATLSLKIQKGYHIQAHEPGNPRFIATNVNLENNQDAVVEKMDFPKGNPFKIQSSPDPVFVYEEKVEFTISGKTSKKTSLKGKLRFQACDDKNCFFPVNADLVIAIP